MENDSRKALGMEKQLLEDKTKKQLLANRWILIQQERRAFTKNLGWSRFSKEDDTRVKLGEINHAAVVGFHVRSHLQYDA